MIHFEESYRSCARDWKPYAGALAITGCLFLALATTRGNLDDHKAAREQVAVFNYIPPPARAEEPPPLPLPARQEPNFKFDFSEDPIPELLPLQFVHVAIGPHLEPSIDARFALSSDFAAQRPTIDTRRMVFDRRDVSSLPEPIHLPNVSLPFRLRRDGAELFVLYRVTTQGRTENIHILSSTNPDINSYAERYLQRVRFRPARRDGQPVDIWVQHALIYKQGPSSPFSIY